MFYSICGHKKDFLCGIFRIITLVNSLKLYHTDLNFGIFF